MSVSRVSAALAATLFAAAILPSAHAQEATDGPDPTKDRLSIGAGIATVPSYEGSDTNVIIPEVVIRGQVSGVAFFSRGPQLFVDLLPEKASDNGWDIGVGPVAGFRLDRVSRIKDAQVRALGKLDPAIELGGWVGIGKTGVVTSAYDVLSARVSIVKDVNGAHGSTIITPAIEYGTPLSRYNFIGLGVSADYVGKGFGRYYYNIDAAGSAASGLPVYTGASGSGWKSARATVAFNQAITGDLTKGLSLLVVGGYSRVLGKYADSPVVSVAGDKDQFVGAVGLTYTF